MHGASVDDGASSYCVTGEPCAMSDTLLHGWSEACGDHQPFTLDSIDDNIIRPTQSSGGLSHSPENGSDIRGRGSDDAQHLSRRRLPLQRLTQCVVALLDVGDERSFSCARGCKL